MVVLGKLGEAYGLRGWVHLYPYGDDPEDWAGAEHWWLAREADGNWQQYGVKDCKWRGETLIALLAGVQDRTQAEKLKGYLVALPHSDLPPTAEGEYYWGDLIGLTVVNTAGETLGQVESLLETGANDVMQVVETRTASETAQPERKVRLLPFIGSVILDVDQTARVIRVEWGLDW